MRACSVSQSFSRPTATINPSFTTMVSASRMGWSKSPDSSRPMFLITTLPEVAWVEMSAMGVPVGWKKGVHCAACALRFV
ncbi:hypothetical protein D3C72_1860470 [compost metagenome]